MQVGRQTRTQDGRSGLGHFAGFSAPDLPGHQVQEDAAGDRRLQPAVPDVLQVR